MQREIKFRAWNIPNKLMYDNVQDRILGVSLGKLLKDTISVLFEYIGFKDKKGIEIYTNYICKYYNRVGVINYSKTHPAFVLSCSNEEFTIDKFMLKKIVVLGNIYENPEIKIT